nr:PDDEXK nuclease domain-containing protein [Verrucomicrobium spinosum]
MRELILQARQKVLSTAHAAQVRTYWEIGRHIVEYEQGGEARAEYGARLLPRLAEKLTEEFGRGFDASNLHKMKQFYLSFPILDALRPELSWTHYRLLERQIGSLSYERLLSSQNKALPVEVTSPAVPTARDFVRDPVMLEFLGLPEAGRLLEADLESALMDKLQQFLLELGRGFAFVARQQRVSTETQDFYIDLVFYNYLLKCFVLIDLKTGHLAPSGHRPDGHVCPAL